MSTVYRAYDSVMGREVALKRLLPLEETNLNEASHGVLAREAAALARFQHPNVVTIFALEEDSEGPYVVMELIEGEDLNSLMKSGALSWEDFRSVAGQCLEPLVAAGDLNLLHRDIKPGNIMLSATVSGRFLVKLLDFGLAKFSQQPSTQTLDQRGSFLGSIEFIAPEQLELRPLDQRTDLYSLGCVFYYMLVQESPFVGGSPAETSMNHMGHQCRPIREVRPDLPPPVAAWIMRLISREPGDRPADARAALREFQDASEGLPFAVPLEDAEVEGVSPIESEAPGMSSPEGSVNGPVGTIPFGEPAMILPSPRIVTASGPIAIPGETNPVRLRTGPVRSVNSPIPRGRKGTKQWEPPGRNHRAAVWVGFSALIIIVLFWIGQCRGEAIEGAFPEEFGFSGCVNSSPENLVLNAREFDRKPSPR